MKGNIYKNKGGYMVRFGRDVSKWFKRLDEAERFLNGLRYETDKGTFDIRDYQTDKPLAFEKLAEKYLEVKQHSMAPGGFRNVRGYINRMAAAWGSANVKSIGYGEIEDFLNGLNVSDKTRSNVRSTIYNFFTWVNKREGVPMPDMPKVKFELGWRNIIDIETQQAILAEVHRLYWNVNPKIYIGIKWLCTYIAFRPNELRNLKEKHIDVNGFFIVPSPKEDKPKIISMLAEDIDLYHSMPRGLPELYFFRHIKGNGAVKPGGQFGKDYLYKCWKQACRNLGVEGVDLYGGTRHSSASALSKMLTPEQIKAGTMHATNKAFERYFQRQVQDSQQVYEAVRNLQHTYNQNGNENSGKLLKFKQ
jgi:integrase